MALFNWKSSGVSAKSKSRVGLEIGPTGIAVALMEHTDEGRDQLIDFDFIEETDPLKQRALLLNWTGKYAERGLSCVVTLHPTDYQLLLVETPNVPERELHSAMRWRLKDLLNYSVDQAVYDVFRLPEDAYRGKINMCYVAVAPAAAIKKIVSMVQKNSLKTERITIREMSYRNLVLAKEEKIKDSVCIWLEEDGGSITLVGGGQIYFSRRIENDSSGGWSAEQLIKEVERSVSYAKNQLGRSELEKIDLIGIGGNEAAFKSIMENELGLAVSGYNIAWSMDVPDALRDRLEDHLVPAVGAAAYPLSE